MSGTSRARREYFRRMLDTGGLIKGFPLIYTANTRPPPMNTIVNGFKTPRFMFCWKLVIEGLNRKYNLRYAIEIRSLYALPRWKAKYADQYKPEMLPLTEIVEDYLLVVFGNNVSEEQMDSIMDPELIAAVKDVYSIPDDLPAGSELKWIREEF
ncbi:hypothetical protein CPB85DRAFT_1021377 [Mucidula mucida]|nr:hypothetical protein CPB85DRAFT_1021377 [Mucidula mucida]